MEWKQCNLEDLVIFQRGYDLPKSEMIDGIYPVVGSNGIIGYHNQYTTEAPSISIGRSGNVGNPFIHYGRTWSHNTALYIREYKNCEPVFIYYLLKTLNLNKFAGGSAVPTLNRNHIASIKVRVPKTKEEQGKIASILSLIDKKIELNEKINDNLQHLIHTMYDYWFLQYEFPNSEGKPYRSNGGKFKWDFRLKKEIPINWEVYTLKDLLSETKIPFDYESNQPTIDLSIMPSGSISLSQLNESSMFQTNLFKMKQGDLLFGSIRPYLLKAGIAPCDGVVAGTVHSYSVKNSDYYNLALCLLTSRNMFNYAVKTSGGTKMPVVSSDSILNYPFAFSPEIAIQFNKLSISEPICKNVQEINQLTKLREYLLPLLINGQISVQD